MSKNFRVSYLMRMGMGATATPGAPATSTTPPLDATILELFEESEIPLDRMRELLFERGGLSAQLRPVVWQLLLHVLPPARVSWEAVRLEQRAQYEDLCEFIEPLCPAAVADELTRFGTVPVDLARMVHAHFTLVAVHAAAGVESRSHAMLHSTDRTAWIRVVLTLARMLLGLFDEDESAAFWTMEGLIADTGPIGLATDAHTQITCIALMLESLSSVDAELRGHLTALGDDELSFAGHWFRSVFLEVLPEAAVARVLDSLLASSWRFLPYFGAALLVAMRAKLLRCKTSAQLHDHLHGPVAGAEVDAALLKSREMAIELFS
eukprot:c4097_g1_i1.p1 GENE.c4097_g1_i1~~c4097_g1_i1.p1  ORF type:complete len:322 (+),score=63.43 c4097_g1_i1:101-1066(+)